MPTKFRSVLSLFMWALALALPSVADEVLSATAVHDGSTQPPGFLITVDVQSSRTEAMLIEVYPFEILEKTDDMRLVYIGATPATGDSTGGGSPFRTLVETIEGKIVGSVVVPYASLPLPVGVHELGFHVICQRDGEVVCVGATQSTSINIGDETRTSIATTVNVPVHVEVERQGTAITVQGRTVRSEPWTSKERISEEKLEQREQITEIKGGFYRTDTYFMVKSSEDGDSLDVATTPLRNQAIFPSDESVSVKDRTIYFATTRRIADLSDTSLGRYGNDYAPGLRRGKCLVNIPLHRVRGRLPQARSLSVFDPHEHFRVVTTTPMADIEQFYADLANTLRSDADTSCDDILLSIHGFNNSMEFAVLRLAQISLDMGFPGAKVLFCWPSNGKIRMYKEDKRAAIDSAPALASLLEEMAQQLKLNSIPPSGAKQPRIHIIAHSMGCEVLLKSMKYVTSLPEGRNVKKAIGKVILAAPDAALSEFLDHIYQLAERSENVTMYVCREDKALLASAILGGEPRIGSGTDHWPFFVIRSGGDYGLDNIRAENASTSFLGHDYFSSQNAVLIDMRCSIVESLRAFERSRLGILEEVRTGNRSTWFFP